MSNPSHQFLTTWVSAAHINNYIFYSHDFLLIIRTGMSLPTNSLKISISCLSGLRALSEKPHDGSQPLSSVWRYIHLHLLIHTARRPLTLVIRDPSNADSAPIYIYTLDFCSGSLLSKPAADVSTGLGCSAFNSFMNLFCTLSLRMWVKVVITRRITGFSI